MKQASQRPTIKTIAREANVTANTVSLALHDSPLVKPETKAMILKIARRQGYVPNVLAKSLRSGRSRFIALAFGDLSNPLFAMKTKKMEHELHERGYQVMILNTNEDPPRELQAVRTAITRKVDGVVLCPCLLGREALDMLQQYHIPCVLVGRNFDDGQEDSVVWDNVTGGYLATRHLIAHGCRRILHLRGPEALSTTRERLEGYTKALAEAGLPVESALQCTPRHGGVAEALAGIRVPYDGIFAFSDLLAWEAACHVREGVEIIGFDNIQSSLRVPFALSSIGANLDDETKFVVDLLLERIENPGKPTQRVVLPVYLVER